MTKTLEEYKTDGTIVTAKSGGHMGIFSTVSLLNDKTREIKALQAERDDYKEALEKVIDHRKIGHSEPDNYTKLGCLANIANEALEKHQNLEDK